jgi:hypothetical protein
MYKILTIQFKLIGFVVLSIKFNTEYQPDIKIIFFKLSNKMQKNTYHFSNFYIFSKIMLFLPKLINTKCLFGSSGKYRFLDF